MNLAATPPDGNPERRRSAHVVVLINYITPHQRPVFQSLANKLGRLTVLVSTAMEPNRQWKPDWGPLDVRTQRNWMITRKWRHTAGFEEDNYIHIPWDTGRQLSTLRPDIVVSYEMGMRTLFSCVHRALHPRVPLVMATNMSEHTEKNRGALRPLLRRFLARQANLVTYNGPSCKRYLRSLGLPESKLFHAPYAADPSRIFRGPVKRPERDTVTLFYSGALSERKAIVPFCKALNSWCQANPERKVEMVIAGVGSFQLVLEMMARPPNLQLSMLGHCEAEALRQCYASADVYVYPTLADEWGLGIEEAMASGLPVIASQYSQAAEVLCSHGQNAWLFDSHELEQLQQTIDIALRTPRRQRWQMGEHGRAATAHITPDYAASCMLKAIDAALSGRVATASAENSAGRRHAPAAPGRRSRITHPAE